MVKKVGLFKDQLMVIIMSAIRFGCPSAGTADISHQKENQ